MALPPSVVVFCHRPTKMYVILWHLGKLPVKRWRDFNAAWYAAGNLCFLSGFVRPGQELGKANIVLESTPSKMLHGLKEGYYGNELYTEVKFNVVFVPPPLFWGWILLILRSPKGGCCSISDDLSCFCVLSKFLNIYILMRCWRLFFFFLFFFLSQFWQV